jgi:hypothetical protein
MFKSKKKRQQKEQQKKEAIESSISEIKKYQLLDDIQLAHDFRSSVILPQLNKDLDAQLPPMIKNEETSPPMSPTVDSSTYYEQIAAWRHQRNQRFSNGLFGGKHRGRPKITTKRSALSEQEEDHEEEEEKEKVQKITHE